MKFRAWIILLVLGAGGTLACDAPAADAGSEQPARQVAMEADAVIGSGDESSVVYVDVRTDAEYAAGHVQGAIHIPHDRMAERYAELERYEDREIVVYCRSGRRSGIAQDILESQGFDNITNGGGLSDLRAQGVPTTR